MADRAVYGPWRKSSHSGNDGNCVEVAWSSEGVSIRDSKSPAGGRVTVRPVSFARWMTTLKVDA